MTIWDVGQIPFVYAPQEGPSNGDLPNLLPFRIALDEQFGHIVQPYESNVEAALKQAYVKGSMISGIMNDTGIGRKYAEDALAFIQERYGAPLEGRAVLDIGCGTGYFLSRVRDAGAEVLGIEPGIHGQEAARRFGVSVVRDFFPSSQVPQSFDVITAFFVLEHLRDIEGFLADVKTHLKDKGVLFLGVPNCEPYLASGDVSFFFHEHWNYFTRWSLQAVLRHVLGVEAHVVRSGFGGSLYAAARLDRPIPGNLAEDFAEAREEFAAFKIKAVYHLRIFTELLFEAARRGETVGIFVPGRAVNFLGLNREQIDLNRLRFFDDDAMLHGTYFPGIPIPVESRRDLLERPPDRLLIMSHTFGEVIARSLREAGFSRPIQTWDDIFRPKRKDREGF